jgi:hypothetical protein
MSKHNLLPYPSHVASPMIEPIDIKGITRTAVTKANRVLQTKWEEISRQALELQELLQVNQEVYGAKYSFEPLIGQIYHLYLHEDGTRSLSLISPQEWSKTHLYSVRLNSDHTWTRVG